MASYVFQQVVSFVKSAVLRNQNTSQHFIVFNIYTGIVWISCFYCEAKRSKMHSGMAYCRHLQCIFWEMENTIPKILCRAS